MSKTAIEEGVFLRMDPDTAAAVWQAVESMGHEKTADGLLNAFLDMVADYGGERREAPTASRVVQYFMAKPQQLRGLKDAATQILAMFAKRKS